MRAMFTTTRGFVAFICIVCLLAFTPQHAASQSDKTKWAVTNVVLHLALLGAPMFIDADLNTNWGSNDNTMIFNSGYMQGSFNFVRPSANPTEHFNDVSMSGWYWTLLRSVKHDKEFLGNEAAGNFVLLFGKKSPTDSKSSIIFEGGWSGGLNLTLLKDEHGSLPFRVTCGIGTQFNVLNHFTYYLRPGIDVKIGDSFTANAEVQKSIVGTKWLTEDNTSISVKETRLVVGFSWLFGSESKEGRDGIAIRYCYTSMSDGDGYLDLTYGGIYASYFFPMW